MKESIIFTDGSSRGNPGPGGWGAIIKFKTLEGEQVKELGGREENTTNNRMEMTAVIEALYFLSKIKSKNPVVVYSDSSYVVNGASKWAFGWEKNGWKTKDGGEVLNIDLWKKLIDLAKNFEIKWQQIAGHSDIPANERCDEIATAFADKNNISLYEGSLENYTVDLLNVVAKEGVRKTSSTKKAYSYLSKVDGEIQTHKTWAECEKRVKGKSGALFKKSFSKEDEEKIIAEFGK